MAGHTTCRGRGQKSGNFLPKKGLARGLTHIYIREGVPNGRLTGPEKAVCETLSGPQSSGGVHSTQHVVCPAIRPDYGESPISSIKTQNQKN
jgi:hypothetical protein